MIQYLIDRQYFDSMEEVIEYMYENRIYHSTILMSQHGRRVGIVSLDLPRGGYYQ